MVMYNFKDFLSKFRHYFRFSKEEIEACVISVLALAFIVSFDEWGYGTNFDFNVGLINFIKAIFIVGIVLGVQIVVTKIQALQWGFRAEFKLWWYGIIIGLGLCFFSGSITNSLGAVTVVWFLAPGGIFFHHLAAHRLGWFRYGVNLMETGLCAMLGSLSSILLAFIAKIFLYFFPDSLFFAKFLSVCLWIGLFTLLPIPPLNGSRVFFWSRLTFAIVFGSIIGANIFFRLDINLILMLILSFLIGVIVWASILFGVERR